MKDVKGNAKLEKCFEWIYCRRRHFVSSTGIMLPGAKIYGDCWLRIEGISQRTVTETQIPKIDETYYAAASIIDRQNRCRQQDSQLEKKIILFVIGLLM